MNIGILGFGRFGQFLAKTFSKYHKVFAHSRSDYTSIANENDIIFYKSIDDFFNEKIDIIVISVSINSFESYLISLEKYYKKMENTLIVDVLSVKVYAEKMIKKYIPLELYNIDYLNIGK